MEKGERLEECLKLVHEDRTIVETIMTSHRWSNLQLTYRTSEGRSLKLWSRLRKPYGFSYSSLGVVNVSHNMSFDTSSFNGALASETHAGQEGFKLQASSPTKSYLRPYSTIKTTHP
jgi:hypothetical protein